MRQYEPSVEGISIPDLRGSLTLVILVICVSVYATQAVLNLVGAVPYHLSYSWLGISRAGLSGGWLWQPLTCPFVHFGIPHLVFNMLTLAFLGSDLERRMGWKHYLSLNLLCILIGSVGFLLFAGQASIGGGYSGGIYGILAASAVLYPDRMIRMFWVFPMRMKWAMLFLGVMAFFAMIERQSDGIEHSAHLFGALAGYVYVRLWRHPPKAAVKFRSLRSRRSLERKKRDYRRQIPDRL